MMGMINSGKLETIEAQTEHKIKNKKKLFLSSRMTLQDRKMSDPHCSKQFNSLTKLRVC